eukprot:scaffold106584_cov31-Tisochrysis_lutea.AAC.4
MPSTKSTDSFGRTICHVPLDRWPSAIIRVGGETCSSTAFIAFNVDCTTISECEVKTRQPGGRSSDGASEGAPPPSGAAAQLADAGGFAGAGLAAMAAQPPVARPVTPAWTAGTPPDRDFDDAEEGGAQVRADGPCSSSWSSISCSPELTWPLARVRASAGSSNDPASARGGFAQGLLGGVCDGGNAESCGAQSAWPAPAGAPAPLHMDAKGLAPCLTCGGRMLGGRLRPASAPRSAAQASAGGG